MLARSFFFLLGEELLATKVHGIPFGQLSFMLIHTTRKQQSREENLSFTSHQHAQTELKSVKGSTSHTSQPLHSHARDMQRVPRSQTRIRSRHTPAPGSTPRVAEPVQPPRLSFHAKLRDNISREKIKNASNFLHVFSGSWRSHTAPRQARGSSRTIFSTLP